MRRRLILLVLITPMWLLSGCRDQPSLSPIVQTTIVQSKETLESTKLSHTPAPTESRMGWLPTPPENPTIIQLTDNPGWRESYPIWSPDGSQILFLSNRECAVKQEGDGWDAPWLCEKEEIYLMDADGNNQIRLTDTQSDDSLFVDVPIWSPDGKDIAVSFHYFHERYLQRVFTFSIDQISKEPLGMDDMEVLIDEGDEYIVSSFLWSPDGKKFAYDYHKYNEVPPEQWDIVIVNIESGEEVFRKTSTGDTICFFEEWSPNSEGILVMCDVDFGAEFKDDIYWIEMDGKNEKLLIENATDPIWSPDGNWILYYSRETRQKELFHVKSSKVIPLPYDGDIWGMWSWSPDGKWLAITGSSDGLKSDIYLLDMSWLEMEWDE